MSKIVIDGKEIDVPAEYTLLQACEMAGAEVPRFCFHERLSIAGNCRMCLVEVKGGPPKPTASCAMAVRDLRPGPKGEPPVVETNSPMARKGRQGVMEFLLINHPLDCPICDQGGECDLQDQAMAYGVDSSRYRENKRAVEDKYLGALGRGEDMEITSYLEHALTSELQGNVVDLCPVGALTAKPTEFHARSWEYSKTESVDVMDALGSAIRIDSRGREVIRILPRINEAINEEWISDKTRHVVDGLKTQRLDRPYVRIDGKLTPATWPRAFAAVAAKVKAARPERIGALAGDLASVEEMFALKGLMDKLGVASVDCRQDGSKLDPKWGRASYLFNSTIAGIDAADAIMIIGSNPRLESPVLNARIRKRWLKGDCLIGVVGERADLTYGYNYLGAGPDSLARFADHPPANKTKPMFILGAGAFARPDGAAILALAAKAAVSLGVVKEGWNGFNVLHTAASRVGGLDLGLVPGAGGLDAAAMVASGALDVLFNLGADEIEIQPGAFVVYIGTHGDKGAHRADVILPGAAYTEKTGTHVNLEGRPQFAERAIFPPGDAREDWAILRALSEAVGAKLPFDSQSQLRAALARAHPHLAQIDVVTPADGSVIASIGGAGELGSAPFASPVSDFYLTNPIARASRVMAECSALAKDRFARAAE